MPKFQRRIISISVCGSNDDCFNVVARAVENAALDSFAAFATGRCVNGNDNREDPVSLGINNQNRRDRSSQTHEFLFHAREAGVKKQDVIRDVNDLWDTKEKHEQHE